MGRGIRKTFLLFFGVAVALSNGSVADAQVRSVTDYASPVREGTKTTYADLLRKIFPDVEVGSGAGQEATAQTSTALNHLSGDYKGKVYRGEMRITGVYSPAERKGNRGQLMLLVQAHSDDGELFNWGDISILALFQLEPTLKLLDAADTQSDQFTSFWEEQPLLALSPLEDAVIIANSHHNSSQGYLWLTLISAEDNKLRTIFDLPILLNTNGCGNNFSQTPSIAVLKGSRKGARPNLSVEVKLVKERDDESCEKRTAGYTRYYRALLVWNPSKRMYEARGNALTRLARFNEQNF
jgi:hypothetical protein